MALDISLRNPGGGFNINLSELLIALGLINISEDWKQIEKIEICIGEAWYLVSEVNVCIGESWKALTS